MKLKINNLIKSFKLEHLPISKMWLFGLLIFPTIPLLIYLLLPAKHSWNDFLLNIGTEMVGVWVSVGIVGWLYNRNEAKKWEGVKSEIQKQTDLLIASTIIRMIKVINKKFFDEFMNDFFKEHLLKGNSYTSVLLKFLKENKFYTDEQFSQFDYKSYKVISLGLKKERKEIRKLLNNYISKMRPELIETLEDLSRKIEYFILSFEFYTRQEIDIEKRISTRLYNQVQTIFYAHALLLGANKNTK